MFQIGLKKFFVIKKVRNTVIDNLNGEEIVGSFYKKELQKTIQKEFRIKKVYVKKNYKNYMLNGKDIMICLIAGYIKNIVEMSEYFQNRNFQYKE